MLGAAVTELGATALVAEAELAETIETASLFSLVHFNSTDCPTVKFGFQLTMLILRPGVPELRGEDVDAEGLVVDSASVDDVTNAVDSLSVISEDGTSNELVVPASLRTDVDVERLQANWR